MQILVPRDLPPRETAQHGMAAVVSGVQQTYAEAQEENRELIADKIAERNLGAAAHGLEDPNAAAHGFDKAWTGSYGGVWKFLKHTITDLFPSPARAGRAYRASKDMFHEQRKRSPAPTPRDTKAPPRTGDHCATGASCKSGTDIEWWN
jgi:hypothetical protein